MSFWREKSCLAALTIQRLFLQVKLRCVCLVGLLNMDRFVEIISIKSSRLFCDVYIEYFKTLNCSKERNLIGEVLIENLDDCLDNGMSSEDLVFVLEEIKNLGFFFGLETFRFFFDLLRFYKTEFNSSFLSWAIRGGVSATMDEIYRQMTDDPEFLVTAVELGIIHAPNSRRR